MKIRFSLIVITFAIAATSAAFAQSSRLWSVAVEYFREYPDEVVVWERGTLNAVGQYRRDPRVEPVRLNFYLPPPMRNRPVILKNDWELYDRLSADALHNFEIVSTALGDGFRLVAGTFYGAVAAREDAMVQIGDVVNLSTRAQIAPAAEPVIGGFVVRDQARVVLIRGIGPSLAPFGVTNPASDPRITVYKGTLPHYTNDDWGTRPEAAEIVAVSNRVGAFPLAQGSKDAALLVELPPGAYTVHMEAAPGTAAGTALLEIYVVNPVALQDVVAGAGL